MRGVLELGGCVSSCAIQLAIVSMQSSFLKGLAGLKLSNSFLIWFSPRAVAKNTSPPVL